MNNINDGIIAYKIPIESWDTLLISFVSIYNHNNDRIEINGNEATKAASQEIRLPSSDTITMTPADINNFTK